MPGNALEDVSSLPRPSSAAIAAHHNNIGPIRHCLALLVLFSHCFPLTGNAVGEPLGALTRGQITLGSLAVNGVSW